jgi:hypothetical protein
MEQSERVFPTFCHINDYLLEGYGSLHRMIAVSDPLVLWAPSGFVIEKLFNVGKCKVSAEDLVQYIELGHVQIIHASFEGVLSWAGLGADAVECVSGGLKKLGAISAEYNGPRWPFLYAFGRDARTAEIYAVLQHLENHSRARRTR